MPRMILAAVALPFVLAGCEVTTPTTSADGVSATTTASAGPDGVGATTTASVDMPAGLSAEERFLWSTLTPQARVQAATYIENGGTLTQFMAL